MPQIYYFCIHKLDLKFDIKTTIALEMRRYPVGIQTFERLRKENYIYIDKTDLMWEMTRMKYVFLNRPRRFGKSLLTTTLDAYFKGQMSIFSALR